VRIIYSAVTTAVITLSLIISSSLSALAAPQIVDVRTKKPVEYKQFISALKPADVVFIGETHDEKTQHTSELDIIRSLHAVDPNIAIGIEMFSTEYQQQLDDWTSGKLDEKEFLYTYYKNWSYDWQLYRDIFIFARDNHIPMVALNVPKPLIAKVTKEGGAALTEADKKQLPPHASWTLHPEQKAYMQRITAQVWGDRPVPPRYVNFYDAQALRNSVMGLTILQYKQKNPKTKVIAISGTWHAVRSGAPDDLRKHGKLATKVVLPELHELDAGNITPEQADYLMVKPK
jgi:uncharacterized iron-regulated protein